MGKKMIKKLLCLCSLLIILCFAHMAQAATLVDNGCPDQAANPQANCSKLGAGDRIVVEATECGYSTQCPTESANICRSIINTSNISYFVPLKTSKEWGSFLSQLAPMSPLIAGAEPLPGKPVTSLLPGVSVAPCCLPETVPDVCPGYPCNPGDPGYPNCSSLAARGLPDQLGNRIAGTRVDPNQPAVAKEYYGAQNDVFGPLLSSTMFGDSTINYEVTYTCSNGSWVKSYEKGSCTPIDGQCNLSLNKQTLPQNYTLPADLNMLCGVGSLYKNGSLTETNDRYTWICEGTPTKPNADCRAYKYGNKNTPIDGKCSSAKGQYLATPPQTIGGKCVSGIDTPITGIGTQNDPWKWGCLGIDDGANDNSCFAYNENASFNGLCGPDDGAVGYPLAWLNDHNDECSYTERPHDYTTISGNIASWTCFGRNGGLDASCSATLRSVNGRCSVPDNSYISREPGNPPTIADLPSNGCTRGTPIDIAYNSLTKALTWKCSGQYLGTTDACSVTYYRDLALGLCRISGRQATPPALTSAALCTSGTAINIVTQGPPDNYTIKWTCESNPPGYSDKNCSASYIDGYLDGQCGASHTQTVATAPVSGLCNAGTATPVNQNPAYGWDWYCLGQNGGISPKCWAKFPPPPPEPPQVNPDPNPNPNLPIVSGGCGPADGTPTVSAPVTGLCGVGTPSPVSGSGPWNWECFGANGGDDASCSAPLLGPGACGSSNDTKIPNPPNFNLCSVGDAGPVISVSSGWDWTCSGATVTSCHADKCDECVGALPGELRQGSLTHQTITHGTGSCEVRGTVKWTSVDELVNINPVSTVTLANPESGLTFSLAQSLPSAPSNFCTPCFRKPQSVPNATFFVRRTSGGACNTGTSLDSGQIIQLPITSVTIQ